MSGLDGVFGELDEPLSAPPPQPGATAMGWRLGRESADGMEVSAVGVHRDGKWELTLSRALAGSGSGDATFAPGGEYEFGLAILDGVAFDHNAVRSTLRLLLVSPSSEFVTGTVIKIDDGQGPR